MPTYIFDTDTVTFHQAGRKPVLQRIATIPPDTIYTTIVTVREQLRGRLAIVDQASEGPELVQAYERLQASIRYFSQVNVVSFTTSAAMQLLQLRAKKIRIGTQDLRIAAIVLSVNGILVTSNRRDYDQVPGLLIEDWNQ